MSRGRRGMIKRAKIRRGADLIWRDQTRTIVTPFGVQVDDFPGLDVVAALWNRQRDPGDFLISVAMDLCATRPISAQAWRDYNLGKGPA